MAKPTESDYFWRRVRRRLHGHYRFLKKNNETESGDIWRCSTVQTNRASSFIVEEANTHLDAKLKNRAFRSDMNTLLRPDMPRFVVEQGADTVRTAYFSHLE